MNVLHPIDDIGPHPTEDNFGQKKRTKDRTLAHKREKQPKAKLKARRQRQRQAKRLGRLRAAA